MIFLKINVKRIFIPWFGFPLFFLITNNSVSNQSQYSLLFKHKRLFKLKQMVKQNLSIQYNLCTSGSVTSYSILLSLSVSCTSLNPSGDVSNMTCRLIERCSVQNSTCQLCSISVLIYAF